MLLADFLVTVRFTALETATANAAVDKELLEPQDKLEPSHLADRDLVLAARCRLQPVSLGKHQASKAGLRRSQIQTATRLPKGLLCAAVSCCLRVLQIPQEWGLPAGVPVPQSSGCSLWCLRRCCQMRARPVSLALPACVPASLGNTLFLNVGQCFISLCHSSLGYNKQLQGSRAWFCTQMA